MRPFEWARQVCDDEAIGSMARFVALALALHAKGSHAPQSRCSLPQIARWTGLHRATVVRAMAELTAAEYVVSLKQHAKNGARASNLYLLIHPLEPVDNSQPKSHTATGGVAQDDYPRRTQRPHGGRTQRPLEGKGVLQDASTENVLDLAARIATNTRF